MPEDVYATSKLSADKRIAEGKSPFWNAKEDKMAKGGSIRGHGCESKGKTKGRFV